MITRYILFVFIAAMVWQCAKPRSHEPEFIGPPFYGLTAPDGSRHYLLGTMHVGVGMADLDNDVVSTLYAATIFIAEETTESLMANGSSASEKIVMLAGYSLSQQLGQDYWLRLRSELPDVSSSELDSMHPGDAASKMLGPAIASIPREQVLLDLQINLFGRKNGKKIFGLDTNIALEIVYADAQEDTRKTTIANLKEALDGGGIEYVRKSLNDMRAAYLKGDMVEMARLIKDDGTYSYRRDRAWVASGLIQKNCVRGETCLIYAGAAHLFEGWSNLAGLLLSEGYTSEGYTIERKKSQISLFGRLAQQ